ncbi:OmpA family protein [Vibrio sp. SCSIO 43135]|uniref:OmpA family protein n=1 Tax=Vibrio sp. SCSIO 43135 TaxID=2819096 RepID=UPI00207623AE|nr:OmpA family protein [Vibrio sp. SCSIO 43135]USD40096.1 OmpA family protein [Vibrio sp. SCSIO 43135]
MKKQIVLFVGIVAPVIGWTSQIDDVDAVELQEKCYVENGVTHRVQIGDSVTINNRQGAFEYIQSDSDNRTNTHVLNSVSQGWKECESILAEKEEATESEVDRISITQFEFDSAVLSDSSKKQLKQFTVQMGDTVDTISIVGHTDSEGSDKYNYQLGFERAKAVANYLAEHGVNKKQLQLSSRGEKEPLLENNSPKYSAKNRRVEVEVFRNREAGNKPETN